jgi:hypothetical protein
LPIIKKKKKKNQNQNQNSKDLNGSPWPLQFGEIGSASLGYIYMHGKYVSLKEYHKYKTGT